MTRILGIDPGSRLTGFGVIELHQNKTICVASGCIRINDDTLAAKLKKIYESLCTIIDEYEPIEVAIESVFVHRNVDSALKLGQARGAAITAVATNTLPLSEYTPSEIKKAVVGRGNAAKQQVQHMVKAILGLGKAPQADAADALAAALCHGHHRSQLNTNSTLLNRSRKRRWQKI